MKGLGLLPKLARMEPKAFFRHLQCLENPQPILPVANLFDPATAPEGEPEKVTVGDFIQWKRSDLVSDYPLDEYTATYVARITAGGATEIQVTGTAYNSSAYLFSVSSTESVDFVAGYYHWQLEMVRNSDSERIVVDTGAFTAVPDLDVNGTDPRTHAEIMLDKIESLLQGKADSDVEEYSIGNRSLTKLSIKDLMFWRDRYKAEVAKEKKQLLVKQGKATGSTVLVRFQ